MDAARPRWRKRRKAEYSLFFSSWHGADWPFSMSHAIGLSLFLRFFRVQAVQSWVRSFFFGEVKDIGFSFQNCADSLTGPTFFFFFSFDPKTAAFYELGGDPFFFSSGWRTSPTLPSLLSTTAPLFSPTLH